MHTAEISLAPWANLEKLAIDYRFPYSVAGPEPYIGYLSLFDRYADSELGEHHAGQTPRFVDDFGYDTANGYRQMISDLGFNVHPRDHMQAASKATDALFVREYSIDGLERLARWLPPADFPIVRLVNPLHDVGENTSPQLVAAAGAVVGDIAHGRKTPQDKITEAKVRKVIFDTFYSDLPEHVLERVEAIASHTEDSAAHQAYVWGHDLEANQTANIAAALALGILEHEGPYDHRFLQLVKLAREVGTRTCRELAEATEHFSYIADVLEQSEALQERLENALIQG